MSKKTEQQEQAEREALVLALEQLAETLAVMQRVTQELQCRLMDSAVSVDADTIDPQKNRQQQAPEESPEEEAMADDPLRCDTPILVH